MKQLIGIFIINNNATCETKYTYHYIGSQITTIDIQGKEDETVVKNDQIRIHLGANSRPISFEYYTDIGTEQEASETYYYHYDLHGNVIRVTDDTGTTQITYTYDSLGTILTESNANSIYNPFTWSGEAQVIHDPEFNTTASSPITGLYSSGSGYYNPETGTFLSGTGAPASVNPTSASAEEPTAQSTRPSSQLGIHAGIAAVAGGVPVSAAPATSTDVAPEPTTDTTPIIGIYGGDLETSYTSHGLTVAEMQMNNMEWWSGSYNDGRRVNGVDMTDSPWWQEAYKKYIDEYSALKTEEDRKKYIQDHGGLLFSASPLTAAVNQVDNWNKIPKQVKDQIREDYKNRECCAEGKDPREIDLMIIYALEWAAWTNVPEDIPDSNGTWVTKKGDYLIGYQLINGAPRFFWGPGEPTYRYAYGQVGAPFDSTTKTVYGDGVQGLAESMWKSHNSTDMAGKTTCNAVSNVGDVKIGLFGKDVAYTKQNNGGFDWWDYVVFYISDGSIQKDSTLLHGVIRDGVYCKNFGDEGFDAFNSLRDDRLGMPESIVYKYSNGTVFAAYNGNCMRNLWRYAYLNDIKGTLGVP